MAKKVYIGVGHGGADSGAVANGLKEKDLNLDVAKACRDEIKRHGINVMISRESDATENLSARIKECNTYNPDLALDIHHNAGGGDGVEVFHAKNDKSDDALAQNVLNEIIAIGQNSRGLKTRLTSDGADYFGFVRQVKCPSVLVECAFIDNKNDVKIVDTLAERKTMGIAIAKGVLKTLGITYKSAATTTTTKKSVDELAKEVISGKWGNGQARIDALKKAGYDPDAVQKKVNELMGKSNTTSQKKSVEAIAKEVIQGKWGNGADREKRLTAAGYNYAEVQKKVNQLMK